MATQLAFRDGAFLPYEDLTVGLGTHSFQSGTNVFEGMRAYWSADANELFVFRVSDHWARLRTSARFYGMGLPYSSEELCPLFVDPKPIVERILGEA